MKDSSLEIIKINKNVRFYSLFDGTEYILIHTQSGRIPMCLKREFIMLLHWIEENECHMEALKDKFGSNIVQAVELLCKYGIICKEEEQTKELVLEGDFSKWKLLFESKAYETRSPFLAKLELTYACNYKCKFCYVEGVKRNWLSFEAIKTVLEKLKKAGILDLFITGGEPFLHPNIVEIIDYAHQLKFDITVQTNASYLDEDMVMKLKKYKNITYGISFHSSNEEIFDQFTQVKGSYQKTLDAGKRLKENGIPFFFKLIVTRENEEHIKEDIQFLEELDYKYMIFLQMLPSIEDSRDNSLFGAKRETMEWLYQNGYIKFTPSNCSAYRTKLWIAPNGDVYPCEMVRIKMGNLLEQSFQDIWFSSKAEEVLQSDIYQEPETCQKCSKKEYCNKCLAYNTFKSWSGKMDFFCARADVVKKIYSQSNPEV